MKAFLIDELNQENKSYQDLFSLLNSGNIKFKDHKCVYQFFSNIIHSIINNIDFIIIAKDFNEFEIQKLVKNIQSNSHTQIESYEDFQNKLRNSISEISLFTSGSTGRPKKVTHKVTSLLKNTRFAPKYNNDIWAFTYHPAHMAGLQVLLQALINLNTIVNIFNYPRLEIFNLIEKYKITNISATPTFYKMLFPADTTFNSINKVTLGGEKADEILYNKLKNLFPNAKLTNIYATTESGALFSSGNNIFTVDESLKKFVRVISNELHLNKEIVSESIKLENNWYPSGDIIEVLNQEPLTFKFTSRSNEDINVGGYKVNPYEVENEIMNLPDILDAHVYGKKNPVTGNILLCTLIKKENSLINEKEIVAYLKTKLPDFKIPRLFNFVRTINKTYSIKKVR